jgi:hypothetical protein
VIQTVSNLNSIVALLNASVGIVAVRVKMSVPYDASIALRSQLLEAEHLADEGPVLVLSFGLIDLKSSRDDRTREPQLLPEFLVRRLIANSLWRGVIPSNAE